MKRRKRTRTDRSLKIESLEMRQLMAADLLAAQAEPVNPGEGPMEVRTFETVAQEVKHEYGIGFRKIPGLAKLPFPISPRHPLFPETSDSNRLAEDFLAYVEAESRLLDVNGDGSIAPIDALSIITVLNSRTGGSGPVDQDNPSPADRDANDITLDGKVSPADALVLINYLNQRAVDAAADPLAFSKPTDPCQEGNDPEPDVKPSQEEKEAKELLQEGKPDQAAKKFEEAGNKRLKQATERYRQGRILEAAQIVEQAGEDFAAEEKAKEAAGHEKATIKEARKRAANTFALAGLIYEQAAGQAIKNGSQDAVSLTFNAAEAYRKAADQLDSVDADDGEQDMKRRYRTRQEELWGRISKYYAMIGGPQDSSYGVEELEEIRCYLQSLPGSHSISVRELAAVAVAGGRRYDPIGREMDWGDAPDTYDTTMMKNGPRHLIIPNIHLGTKIDGEFNGLPDSQAKGDDHWILPFFNDEDGVVFTSPLIYGQAATIQVTASVPGFLDAWFDFDADGQFTQAGDQIFVSQPVAAGVNNLSFTLTDSAPDSDQTFMRVRYSTQGGLSHDGPASNGEVEDYVVKTYSRHDRGRGSWDYGDALDSYKTTLMNNGPRHKIVPGIHMGDKIDGEIDGQPGPLALEDDNDGVYILGLPGVFLGADDEDGVVFTSPLIYGQTANLEVTASVPGFLDAWFDFNANGQFDLPTDQIFSKQPLGLGVNNLAFNIPNGIPNANETFARFRFSTAGGLRPTGPANDGEVEDYFVSTISPDGPQLQKDFGDAPASYATLLVDDGPNHVIVPDLYLGLNIDAEVDGQPNGHAMGDDGAGFDDEDGVTFVSAVHYGQPLTIEVVASAAGKLDAWLDFEDDGSFDQPMDHVFASEPLVAGINTLTINMPNFPQAYLLTMARFRLSSGGGLGPTGPALDGEVEDYPVEIRKKPPVQWDYSDAPVSYATFKIDNGPRHWVKPGFYLGTTIDAETDGQPNSHATGDDLAAVDDEDGVTFVSPVHYGETVTIEVVASAAGMLDAWFDFDVDGSFLQPLDQIFDSEPLVAGVNTLEFEMANLAQANKLSFARFRYSPTGGTKPTGPVDSGGEVEDYPVQIRMKPLAGFDFGDAQASYDTLLIHNGPRHPNGSGVHLGTAIDTEVDGQPSGLANGDDVAGVDDEDGVTFVTPVTFGQTVTVEVVASAAAKLDAWLDIAGDGNFLQPIDQIFNNQPLVAGVNTLTFVAANPNVDAAAFTTTARFRISSAGGLGHNGLAADGEVEDYAVQVQQKPQVAFDYGDAAVSYDTLLVNNGPSHPTGSGLYLGASVDSEVDGQPGALAKGDDNAGIDDEDGVTFVTAILLGQPATIQLVASAAGKLDAWLDFAGDGNFLQPMDQIFDSEPLVAGLNSLTFVAANQNVVLFTSITVARFRISSAGGLGYNGPAADGEVEDYLVEITDRPPPGEPIIQGSNPGGRGRDDGQDSIRNDAAGARNADLAEGESGLVERVTVAPVSVADRRQEPRSSDIDRSVILDEIYDSLEELDLTFLDDATSDASIDRVMAGFAG